MKPNDITIPPFVLSERRMCDNCVIIQSNKNRDAFECKYCGCKTYTISSDYDDHWIAHQANQDALQKIEVLRDRLVAEIEKFDKNWFACWNSNDDQQLGFEIPEVIVHFGDKE